MAHDEKFRFFEHTADIMFEAYGKSYPEALENAAHAMFSVFGSAKETEKAAFIVSAHNIEELAVQSLADLLAYMDTNEMVFSRMKVVKYNEAGKSVEFEAYGEKKQPRDAVKAVTYHEMAVTHDKKGWTIRIILDV
ncbi:MAG: archease [Candidatus Micrarchaeota archaeon]|nr:archease [Candidatus Micrarchaeota archaeon]